MKIYPIAIIGGGFSGLTLATKLSKKYKSDLLIIEANKRIGKKILATGNGQGNITNANFGLQYYHGDLQFANHALTKYDNISLINYFNSLGLVTCNQEGKIYPASLTAGSILDVLRFNLEDNGVTIITENYCEKITKGEHFIIECNGGNKYYAKKVVLAFGGKSGAGFMTDGKSFSIAKALGHSITSLYPSLVQIKTEREKIRGLKGVKIQAEVGLYVDKTHVCTFGGDILFADYGVSGNSIFSLSAYLKNEKNACLKISYLPDFGAGELYEILSKKASSNITNERLLVSILPTRLALAVLKQAGQNASDIATNKSVSAIVNAIKGFTLKVEGKLGFESSQVTAGGICTKEIYASSMQSKINKGLYVIGEALDVDGDCGGYNLQWAYSSASVCAEDILNEKN